MKNILTLIIALCFAYTAQAQVPQIALHHNGSSSFYTSATAAMTAAQNGDTLYFPGGSFGDLSIDKQLVIYGTGIHPDSTSAVGVAGFTTVYLREGSSGTVVQGIETRFLRLQATSPSPVLENITVKRCNITGFSSSTSNYSDAIQSMGTTFDTLRNITFTENIIGHYAQYANNSNYDEDCISYSTGVDTFYNIYFTKNIIIRRVKDVKNTYFFNNIFLSYNSSPSSYYTFQNTKNSYFFNNYFNSSYMGNMLNSTLNLENCAFNNNLFRGSVNFPYVSNFGINNQINQSEAGTFEDVPSSTYIFSFSQDYHLKSTSPGINAGFDGTDIGIYGTAAPTQEGWLPDNPQIIFKSIGNMPDANGNLPVQVQARAVDNQ